MMLNQAVGHPEQKENGRSVVALVAMLSFAALGYVAISAIPSGALTEANATDISGYMMEGLTNEEGLTDRMEADIIGVFYGESACPASNLAVVRTAAQTLADRVHQEAADRSLRSLMVGIAVDRSPEAGLRYLGGFDVFSRRIAGQEWAEPRWIQVLAEQIGHSAARPQLLVFERSQSVQGVQEPRSHELRLRLVGALEIERWLGTESRVPRLAPDA